MPRPKLESKCYRCHMELSRHQHLLRHWGLGIGTDKRNFKCPPPPQYRHLVQMDTKPSTRGLNQKIQVDPHVDVVPGASSRIKEDTNDCHEQSQEEEKQESPASPPKLKRCKRGKLKIKESKEREIDPEELILAEKTCDALELDAAVASKEVTQDPPPKKLSEIRPSKVSRVSNSNQIEILDADVTAPKLKRGFRVDGYRMVNKRPVMQSGDLFYRVTNNPQPTYRRAIEMYLKEREEKGERIGAPLARFLK